MYSVLWEAVRCLLEDKVDLDFSHLATFNHAETLTETEEANNVEREESEPLQHVRVSPQSFFLDPLNRNLCVFSNHALEMLPQVCFAKTFGDDLAPGGVIVGVANGEDTKARESGKSGIPLALLKARRDTVDFLEAFDIRADDFIWRDADDGAVFVVKFVNVVNTASFDSGSFQTQVCVSGMPWPGDIFERGGEGCVDKLEQFSIAAHHWYS